MKQNRLFFVFTILLFVATTTGLAQNVEFGGYPDEVKGAGDKVPPQCQLDMPRAASAKFDIKWFCTDNFTSSADIESKLWIRRNGSQTFELLNTFIGFPAAGIIDESALHVTNFVDGLPATFRLSASDRTGNQAISPAVIVSAGQEITGSCSITVRTAATESTGSTVGTPAMTVTATAQNVLIAGSARRLTISTSSNATADPCEIEDLCFNQEQIGFNANLAVNGTAITGSLEIIPGNVTVPVTGQANEDFQTVRLSGTTTIDGKEANTAVVCTR